MRIMTLISLCLLLLTPPARAEEPQNHKLTRGLVNVITAPLEIPTQTRIYWKEGAKVTDHILVWIFSGFVKGTVNTVARIGSGAWDIVSSPFAVPADYAPLYRPEYVFDDWDQL